MKDFYKFLIVSMFALNAVALCADEGTSSDEHKQQEAVTEASVADSNETAEVNTEIAN